MTNKTETLSYRQQVAALSDSELAVHASRGRYCTSFCGCFCCYALREQQDRVKHNNRKFAGGSR